MILNSITRELFSGWGEEMDKIERKEKKMMEGGVMDGEKRKKDKKKIENKSVNEEFGCLGTE